MLGCFTIPVPDGPEAAAPFGQEIPSWVDSTGRFQIHIGGEGVERKRPENLYP